MAGPPGRTTVETTTTGKGCDPWHARRRQRRRRPRDTRDRDATAAWSDEQLLRQFLDRSGESAEAAFAALIGRHGADRPPGLPRRPPRPGRGPRTRRRRCSSSSPARPARSASPGRSAPGCTGSRSAWPAAPGPRTPAGGPPSGGRPRSCDRHRTAERGARTPGLRRAARGGRPAPREVPAADHPLLHAGADPGRGRRGARLAPGDGPGPPPSRPGPAAVAA